MKASRIPSVPFRPAALQSARASAATSLLGAGMSAAGLGDAPIGGAEPAHHAASTGRRLAGWRPGMRGPNAMVSAEGAITAARSRDSIRNNPHARRIQQLRTTHVVGAGMAPRSQCPHQPTREALNRLWERWVDVADADGRFDFYGLQARAIDEWGAVGEVFGRLRTRRLEDGLPVPFQIQLIPAEQVPLHHTLTTGSNPVLQGIERDALGRRVAYHMHRHHPGDGHLGQPAAAADALGLVRVPAGDVFHLCLSPPGQLRALPQVAAALTTLHQLAQWRDASLLRKQMVTMLVGFVRRAVSGEMSVDEVVAKWGEVTRDLGDLPAVTLEPGTMQYLEPGEDVEFTQWQDTSGADEAFERTALRAVAAAADVLYEELTGDWSQTNDRTFRAAFGTFKRATRQVQHQVLAHQMGRPVWLRFVDLAIASGALSVPPSLADHDLKAVEWQPEAWEHLHPVQDVNAIGRAIELKLTSREAAIAARGDDIEIVDRQIASDREREQRLAGGQPKPVASKPGNRVTRPGGGPSAAAAEGVTDVAMAAGEADLGNPWRDERGRFATGPGLGRTYADAVASLRLDDLDDAAAWERINRATRGSRFRGFLAGRAQGFFLVGVADPDLRGRLGTSARGVVLSAHSARKQKNHHPELQPREYRTLQEVLESPIRYSDKDLHVSIAGRADRAYKAVVKVSDDRREIYLQSFTRLRESEYRRLRRKAEKLAARGR